MKLKCGRYSLEIIPDDEVDVAYLEEVLGLKDRAPVAVARRVNVIGMSSLALVRVERSPLRRRLPERSREDPVKRPAPVLHDLAHYSYGASPEARRELRAVLRVYRAAAHNAKLIKSVHANGGQVCSAEWTLVEAVEAAERLSPTRRSATRRT